MQQWLVVARAGFGHLMRAGGVGALVVSTAAGQPTQDVEGGKDHPLISRYAGSVILSDDVRTFDEFLIPLSPVTADAMGEVVAPAKSQRVEGKVTRIVYVAPEGRTPLEVIRSYEQELTKAGFKPLYTCVADTCGPKGGYNLTRMLNRPMKKYGNKGMFDFAEYALHGFFDDARYLAAKGTLPQGDVYVSLFAGRRTHAVPSEMLGRIHVALDVIETTSMDAGMVTVDAAAMAKEITQNGRVALDGIYFDTNGADLKAESSAAIQEVAKLLEQDRGLGLLVVGHTDNVGDYAANVALSDRRAASVIRELTTKHGVAAPRLRAAGAGMMAPVATNETENGRAKNRRVELVKQ